MPVYTIVYVQRKDPIKNICAHEYFRSAFLLSSSFLW